MNNNDTPRELYPATPPANQPQQSLKCRLRNSTFVWPDKSDVVDHNVRSESGQPFLQFDEVLWAQKQLNMPAQIQDSVGETFQVRWWQSSDVSQNKSHRPGSGVIEPLQFFIFRLKWGNNDHARW